MSYFLFWANSVPSSRAGGGGVLPPPTGYMRALSDLTQFLALEYLLKILKNAFYFTFSIFSLLRSFNSWSDKIYDVIDWETNNGNKHFNQYLKK